MKFDTSLGRYRTEHGLFDEALERPFNEDLLNVPTREIGDKIKTDEVHRLFRGEPKATAAAVQTGAAGTATDYQEANAVPLFPPSQATGLVAQPTTAPKPNLNPNPVQVLDNTAQFGVLQTTPTGLKSNSDVYTSINIQLRLIQKTKFHIQ